MDRPFSIQPTAVDAPCRATNPIKVRLFGRFEITSSDGVPLEISCSKSRELFAYLVIRRERTHRREAVADHLWGERSFGDQRKGLRQALWQLQTVLSTTFQGGEQLVETLGPAWVGINRAIPLTLDLADFENAWSELEEPQSSDSATDCTRRTARALELYRGDLLEGEDWAWCLLERERMRSMFLAMSDRMTAWCVRNGEFAQGVRLASKVLLHDPAREKTHRNLMRLYALTGDRTSALRQFDSCESLLRTELDVVPSQRTRELFELIRSDRPIPLNGMDSSMNGGCALASQAFAAIEELRKLRELLGRTRQDVDLEIQALERSLAS